MLPNDDEFPHRRQWKSLRSLTLTSGSSKRDFVPSSLLSRTTSSSSSLTSLSLSVLTIKFTQVAETRLAVRTHRPGDSKQTPIKNHRNLLIFIKLTKMFLPHCSGVEACHDAPHSRLVNEVKTFFHNVSECLCLDRNCNLKIIVFFSLPLSLASIFCPPGC